MADVVKVNIETLDIPECCKSTLRQMKRVKEFAPMLESTMVASPFVVLIQNPAVSAGQMAGTASADAITKQKDDIWVSAVKAIPKIAKERLKTMAQLERLSHQKDRRLLMFWTRMDESFK